MTNNDKNKKVKKRSFYLKRVNVTGYICILFALILIIINILTNSKWYEYITVGALIAAGIVFIYTSNKIEITENKESKNKK